MADKVSDNFFLHAKAMLIANELRADVRKLLNVCTTLRCDEEFIGLLEALEEAAGATHAEVSKFYDRKAKQVDNQVVPSGHVRFDVDADGDDAFDDDEFDDELDDDEYEDECRTAFMPGCWYKGTLGQRFCKVYICSRFDGKEGTEVVATVDDEEYIFGVDVSVGKFLDGMATEVIQNDMLDINGSDKTLKLRVHSVDFIEAPE